MLRQKTMWIRTIFQQDPWCSISNFELLASASRLPDTHSCLHTLYSAHSRVLRHSIHIYHFTTLKMCWNEFLRFSCGHTIWHRLAPCQWQDCDGPDRDDEIFLRRPGKCCECVRREKTELMKRRQIEDREMDQEQTYGHSWTCARAVLF